MINNKEFAERLQKLITYYSESASSFSEKIGVPRSSISHILSGRNKPSLDFVMKVQSTYPEVELYWLLKGKGDFPLSSPHSKEQELGLWETKRTDVENKIIQDDNGLEKIVFFYKDGTFREYFSK